MYSRDLIETILSKTDIVTVIGFYLPLVKKGRNYMAVCPFHDDHHPSMSVNQEKQIFKCFVCGEGGNAITFVEHYEKMDRDEAVRKVAEIMGISDERLVKEAYQPKTNPKLTPLYSCIDDLQRFYRYGLTIAEGEEAREYLSKRNITQAMIDKFGIGYAPKDGHKTIEVLRQKGHSMMSVTGIGVSYINERGTLSGDGNAGRLIFPIFDANGQTVAFSARKLPSAPSDFAKYVNSPETKIFEKAKILYNYHNAKKTAHKDGCIYVLEGFMDVMALDKAGIPSAVALMGVALTSDHIALLRRLNCEVRLCLDGDEAGQTGMMKAINALNKENIPFRLVSNPGDLRDPDDILQQDGPEALKEAMSHLVDAFGFQLNYYTNVKKLDKPEDKRKIMMYFMPQIRNLPSGIEREDFIVRLAKATGYEPEAIRRQSSLQSPESGPSLEETIYIDAVESDIGQKRLDGTSLLRHRLYRAERQTLYYMVYHSEAVQYYIKNIDNFSQATYNEIANYVVDYHAKRAGEIKLPLLINDIASGGGNNRDELIAKLSDIASDENYPPYSLDNVVECAKAIHEERTRINDVAIAERQMQGKSPREKGEALKELAQKRKIKKERK